MALGTTTAVLLGLGGLGAGIAASKSGMFGGAASAAKQISSAPIPLPEAPSAAAAAEKGQEMAKKKRAAATQSVYTNPLGIGGQADIAKKTLLGQ